MPERGIPAFSPCTYTAQWQGDDLAGGMQPKNGWYELDLAFLKGCRAMIVFMLPGVEDSAGVRMELEYAKAHGIPLYRLEQDDIIPAACPLDRESHRCNRRCDARRAAGHPCGAAFQCV